MSKWPTVPLGEVLRKSENWISLRPDTIYQEVTVRLWGKGVTLRRSVVGADIAANKRLRVCAGQFIISRIDARNGASGIIPEFLNGAVVSSDFPVFSTDPDRLLPEYLGWLSKTNTFVTLCAHASEGTTNRVRLKEPKFLAQQIPLPPRNEQRRLVEHIDSIAAKIEEAKRLRESTLREFDALQEQIATELLSSTSWPILSIDELVGKANLKNGKSLKATSLDSTVRCLTLSSIRNGLIDTTDAKPVPMELAEAQPYLVNRNDVFVVRGNGSKHLVGRAGMVSESTNGIIFPDLFIRIPLASADILPEFFVAVWNSRFVRQRIEDLAKTTSGIWKVNQGHIASITIPRPPKIEQQRVIEQTRVSTSQCHTVHALRSDASRKLNAMLPAILNRAFNGNL